MGEFAKLLREVAPRYLGYAAGGVAGAVGLAACQLSATINTRSAQEKLYQHSVIDGNCGDAVVTRQLRRRVEYVDGKAVGPEEPAVLLDIYSVTGPVPTDAVPYSDASKVAGEQAWYVVLRRGDEVYSSWQGTCRPHHEQQALQATELTTLPTYWGEAAAVSVNRDGELHQGLAVVNGDGSAVLPLEDKAEAKVGVHRELNPTIECQRALTAREIGIACTGDAVAACVFTGVMWRVGGGVARRLAARVNVDKFRAHPLFYSAALGAATATASLPAAVILAPILIRWQHATRILFPSERSYGDGTARWPRLGPADFALSHGSFVVVLALFALPVALVFAVGLAPIGAAGGAAFYAHRVRPVLRKQVAIA